MELLEGVLDAHEVHISCTLGDDFDSCAEVFEERCRLVCHFEGELCGGDYGEGGRRHGDGGLGGSLGAESVCGGEGVPVCWALFYPISGWKRRESKGGLTIAPE